MGLLSVLVAVSVPCILSNQMFYFYPGYVGQPGKSPFLPQGPVVLPYSVPLQTNIQTIPAESMGNRSTIIITIIIVQFHTIIVFLENMNSSRVKPTKATGNLSNCCLYLLYLYIWCSSVPVVLVSSV